MRPLSAEPSTTMTGNRSDPAAHDLDAPDQDTMLRRLAPSASPETPSVSGNDLAASSAALDGSNRPTACGEFDIRIAPDGTWFYHGSPITRKPLVKLFASVLRRDSDGEYWLTTPAENGRIRVDDAPFVAVELTVAGQGHEQVLTFRANLDVTGTAGPGHHIRVSVDPKTGEPRPYVTVRDGLEALIARAVFYQLVELGVEEGRAGAAPEYGVWSRGQFFPLGRMDRSI